MANEVLKIDSNSRNVMGGLTNDGNLEIRNFRADVNGNAMDSLGTLIAGENQTTGRLNVEQVWTPTPITTATTTNVLAGPGTFGGLSVNKKVATGVITVYDALTATGTPKAIHTIGAAMLTDPGEVLFLPMVMAVGCTIVTSQAFDLTAYTRLN